MQVERAIILDTAKRASSIVAGSIILDIELPNSVDNPPLVKVNDVAMPVKAVDVGVWEYRAVVHYKKRTAKVEVWLDTDYVTRNVALQVGRTIIQDFEFGRSE